MCDGRGVEEIYLMKGVQLGGSEWLRGIIGWIAHQDPCQILMVLPDETTGRKIMAEEMLPLFRGTACFRDLLGESARDTTLNRITLANGFRIGLGWAGSPASLASDPCRVVIFDEVDKYRTHLREADPIYLGKLRAQSFEATGRRLIIAISSPTTPDGTIHALYKSAERKLEYQVPCSHCGHFQPLHFPNLKWPNYGTDIAKDWATTIELEQRAWFECTKCKQPIDDQANALRSGRWTEHGDKRSKRVGIHLWAAHSLRVPWHKIAAEFLRCKDGPNMRGFVNGYLGDVFHNQIQKSKASAFAAKADSGASPRIIPNWAVAIIATADTQKSYFTWVVRAWGSNFRSQRIDHGMARTFEELKRCTLDKQYPFADPTLTPWTPLVLGIDSGGTHSEESGISRTYEVYQFHLAHPGRVLPLKGRDWLKGNLQAAPSRVTYRHPDAKVKPFEVWLTLIGTAYYKDMLYEYKDAKDEDGNDLWALDCERDEEYEQQMASEHKVAITKAGRETRIWQKINSGARNEYFDCETYQFALATDVVRVNLMRPTIHRTQPAGPPPARPPRPTPARPPIRRNYG